MRIGGCINTTEEEIKSKKFNIFIGVSLGNKYFNKEHLREYLLWALENTKERAAFLIPDKIHAVNYEVNKKYSKEKAERIAFKLGEKIRIMIESIIEELEPKNRSLIKILKWQDIETEEYSSMQKVIQKSFSENEKFKKIIIEIVRENIKLEQLNDGDYEKLANYPLNELPMLISGIEYEKVRYDLLPYPGISKIDELILDLQKGVSFPKITEELNIKNKLRIIEAYAE